MSSYKIYLTKSYEAATRISKTFLGEYRTNDILNVSVAEHKDNEDKYGVNHGNCRIPAIYAGKGYWFCLVELKPNEGWDSPTYELTIC